MGTVFFGDVDHYTLPPHHCQPHFTVEKVMGQFEGTGFSPYISQTKSTGL
jgi:hypothetical protein